jgi:hypothetical protein
MSLIPPMIVEISWIAATALPVSCWIASIHRSQKLPALVVNRRRDEIDDLGAHRHAGVLHREVHVGEGHVG